MMTSKKTNALSEITVGELIDKLNVPKVKGALYSLFHHTKIESFANMVNGGSVWMSRIDQMNDGTEVFKDADRTYAFCLSAKPTENVGMWIAMLDRKTYNLMKKKYSDVGSWAVWCPQRDKNAPKSNMGNMEWAENEGKLCSILNPNYFKGRCQ